MRPYRPLRLEALEDRTAPALFSLGGATIYVPDANAAPLAAAVNQNVALSVQMPTGVVNLSGTLTSLAATSTAPTNSLGYAATVTVPSANGPLSVSGILVGSTTTSTTTVTTTPPPPTSSLGGLLDPIGTPVGG